MDAEYSMPTLPQFLRFLSAFPDAQVVAEALMRGPLAAYGARACNILPFEPPNQLVLAGATGISERVMTRYQVLPLDICTPQGRSFNEAIVVICRISEMLRDYPAVQIDVALWEDQLETMGDLTIICAPMIANGVTVGAYNTYLPRTHELDTTDIANFEGIGAVLGMWLTHQHSNHVFDRAAFDRSDEHAFHLTARQLQVLALVEQGRSNSAIGAQLGYSPSTVKQELQRAMKVLRVNDRLAAAAKARELGLQSPLR